MELVYLWVEDYKNIKLQGFNFSPRFRCEYDEETKELEIVDKEETGEFNPKSFFGDKINITAIVGENGSGKSSIFEIFSKILTLGNPFEEFSYFYVLYDGCKNICYSNNINVLNKDIIVEKHIPKLVINKKLTRGKNNFKVTLSKYFDVNYLNISHLEKDGIIKNDSPSPEVPIKYYGIYAKNDINTAKYGRQKLYPTYSEFELSQFNLFQTYAIGNLLVDEKYKELFFNIFKIKQPYSIKIDYTKENLEKTKTENTANHDPFKAIDESVPDKIDKILNFLIEIDNNLVIESDNYKIFFKLISSVYNLEKEFQLTFQTKENKPIKLSSGEKTILFYLERIDFMLSRFEENRSNILLFDEIELYLHPNWQKRILKIILDFIQENKLVENLHIIIASHSPFLLSDLPKENVIFLEKGKQVYPFQNGQTFGANIHTLLSHGFFMKDGLMGEFAKDKIKSIIIYHEEIEKKEITTTIRQEYKDILQKQFWQIQSIIGDDYLKQVIKNHLIEIEKIVLGNDEAKKEEVKRLKAQIELLEK
jgi:predicted ATPase